MLFSRKIRNHVHIHSRQVPWQNQIAHLGRILIKNLYEDFVLNVNSRANKNDAAKQSTCFTTSSSFR